MAHGAEIAVTTTRATPISWAARSSVAVQEAIDDRSQYA